jgi:hypothetical protein
MVEKLAIVLSLLSGAIALPVMLLSVSSKARLFGYLRTEHYNIWLDLGSPPLSGLRSTVPSFHFLAACSYMGVHDPQLWQLARRARRWLRIYMATSAVLIASFLTAAATVIWAGVVAAA